MSFRALLVPTGVVTAKARVPSLWEALLLCSSFQPVDCVEKTLGRSMWNPFSDGFCELVWVPFVTVMKYKLESFFPHKRFCKKI